jgi:serine/threonine protein phosphatase PrpC
MAVISRQNCAGLTDPGRKRENNEDRFHADPDRGIFFVIDGVGGQAAGEKAADTAYNLLRARLERPTGTPAERVREAITIANNEIFRLSQSNEAWRGMACVLTVAVLEDGQVTIGQVGDSRLYLLEPGDIRKVTHDHSPVGEREDRGEIDELTAMRHPRRNEVYRDVGSEDHAPDDPDFIEITTIDFPSSSALLLCSDGLSDLVPSTQILAIVEQAVGDPQGVAQALIDAANNAGGKDNVTIVFVEGDNYAGGVRRRSSATRKVPTPRQSASGSLLTSRWMFLLLGLLGGCAIAVFGIKPLWRITSEGQKLDFGAIREPRVWRITSDISAALQNAKSGDTIMVAPGQYHEQVVLKEGVDLISEQPRQAIIRAEGIAIQANDIHRGRFEGFRITGEEQNNLAVGIQLNDSNVEIADNEVTNATIAAVECLGESGGVFRANAFYGNPGAGIIIRDAARPRFVHNTVTGNGGLGKRPGVEIHGAAQPVLMGNIIWNNAGEAIFAPAQLKTDEILKQNFVSSPETFTAKPSAPHRTPDRAKPRASAR